MNKNGIVTVVFWGFMVIGNAQNVFAQPSKLGWVSKVGAKQFPSVKRIFKVNAFSDSTKLATKAIQAAIDECAGQGGGIVAFNPGVYVSGSLFIKSEVQLRIDRGVLIFIPAKFSSCIYDAFTR